MQTHCCGMGKSTSLELKTELLPQHNHLLSDPEQELDGLHPLACFLGHNEGLGPKATVTLLSSNL